MRNIFIGLLFIFLNFNITIGASIIGLIPGFIGYIYILKGFDELKEQGEWFTRLRPYATGMAIYSGVLYVFDLLGISTSMGALFTVPLGLVSTIISLYISYGIVMGIKDMEVVNQFELNTGALLSAWKVMAFCAIISYLVIWIPIIAIIGIIIGFIASIWFLYSFSQSKNKYYSLI